MSSDNNLFEDLKKENVDLVSWKNRHTYIMSCMVLNCRSQLQLPATFSCDVTVLSVTAIASAIENHDAVHSDDYFYLVIFIACVCV
jgi:hypothetical protein